MSIFDLFSSSGGINAAAQAKKATNQAARKGYQAASGDLSQGLKQQVSSYNQALPQWQTIFNQGTAMQPYYMGGLGIGTPQQVSAANEAFMGSIPGQEYNNQLKDIYEAALRSGGLTGQTGQIPIDLTNETMKSLNQFYQPWQSALNPYNLETAGATGQSNVYGNIANAYGTNATNQANLATNKFNTIGAAKAAYPQNVYAAQQGAASNQLSALFGLGSLASSLFGSGNVGSLLGGGGGGGGSGGGGYDPNWPATVTYG